MQAFAKLQDVPEKLFDHLFAFAMEPVGTGFNKPTRAKSVQSILFRQFMSCKSGASTAWLRERVQESGSCRRWAAPSMAWLTTFVAALLPRGARLPHARHSMQRECYRGVNGCARNSKVRSNNYCCRATLAVTWWTPISGSLSRRVITLGTNGSSSSSRVRKETRIMMWSGSELRFC